MELLRMKNFKKHFTTVNALLNKLKQRQQSTAATTERAITECLAYVNILQQEKVEYTLYFAQQLLRAILDVSREHPEALLQFDRTSKIILETNLNKLFSIYSTTFMNLSSNPPDELFLLTLFLNYMTRELVLKKEDASLPNEHLFSLRAEEKASLERLVYALQQWFQDLMEIKVVNAETLPSEKLKVITAYTSRTRQKITEQTDFYIIPSGFARLSSGPGYPGAAIVEVVQQRQGLRHWAQVDPLSPYHQKAETLKKQLRSITLDINEIPLENITELLLTELITVKSITPNSSSYTHGHLYEIILAKLNGKTQLKTDADFLFKSSRENIFCSTWSVLRDVVYYLLTRMDGPQLGGALYKKIICGFHFDLLKCMHREFEELSFNIQSVWNQQTENQMLQSAYSLHQMCSKIATYVTQLESIDKRVIAAEITTVNRFIEEQSSIILQRKDHFKIQALNQEAENKVTQYAYLLHEMCAKIAAYGVKLEAVERSLIVAEIEAVNSLIAEKNSAIFQLRVKKRTIQEIFHTQPNFQSTSQAGLSKLSDKQFFGAISSDATSGAVPQKKFIFPIVEQDSRSAFIQLEQLHNSLQDFLKMPKLKYSINNAYQISFVIENTILSLLRNGLTNWYNDSPESLTEVVAHWLLEMSRLYYSALCRINQEHKCVGSDYNPIHYGKLVVLTQSIYVMLDVLARKDALIGPILQTYRINTHLNAQLFFDGVWKELILPNKAWVRMLGEIKLYLNDQKQINQILFGHGNMNKGTSYCYFPINFDADQNDQNIKFAIALLEKFPEKKNKLHLDFQDIAVDLLKPESIQAQKDRKTQKWMALFFGQQQGPRFQYLPSLFCCLRDSAYLSLLSLGGVSSVTFNNDTKKQYDFPGRLYYNISGSNLYLSQAAAGHQVSLPNMTLDQLTQYRLEKKQQKYQSLLYPKSIPISRPASQQTQPSLENQFIANHADRPEGLTKSQYITLGFIRTDSHIKLSRLFLALRDQTLSFENEAHCLLMKQTLFEISEFTEDSTTGKECSFLEKRFNHQHFSTVFVRAFTVLALQLQQKLSQYQPLGHMLDILLYLHSFSMSSVQESIDACFEQLRHILLNVIQQEKVLNTADYQKINIWHAYIILSYKTKRDFTPDDLVAILLSRLSIEQSAMLRTLLPKELYAKMMEVLLLKQDPLATILQAYPDVLDSCLSKDNAALLSPGHWQLQQNQSYYYQRNEYALDFLYGRLYKNNLRVGGLTKPIYDHPDYKAAFGDSFLLVEMDKVLINQKQLIRYSSVNSQAQNNLPFSRRITLLNQAASKIWLEEKLREQRDEDYHTFIPLDHLKTLLPKVLITGYTHWQHNNLIYIKNDQREAVFRINLTECSVFSFQHEQFVMPFHLCPPNHEISNQVFWKILTAFEDSQYILVLTDVAGSLDAETDAASIYLPRFKLSFIIKDQKIHSNDFKGYHLAPCQQTSTLFGLSNYLVLESTSIASSPAANAKRKVIIGHRNALHENSVFTINTFQVNLESLAQNPSYFTYEVDPLLETLHAESVAAKLYLAWLFYKTASLSRDTLTQMNCYEMTSELLKSCWQNYAYDTLELEMLLRFLGRENVRATIFASCEEDDEIEDLSPPPILGKEQHRNAVALTLRVLSLMNESLETHFLHKKESSVKLYEINNKARCHNLISYGASYFSHYLNVKNRIHKKCQLSLEEERKFLRSLREINDDEVLPPRLETYLKVLEITLGFQVDGANPMSLQAQHTSNYKALVAHFASTSALQDVKFSTEMNQFLSNQYGGSYYGVASLPLLNHFADWVDFSTIFDFRYFLSFYQSAVFNTISNTLTKEKFESILNVIALNERTVNSLFLYLRMLYIIICRPLIFIAKPIPEFLLLQGALQTNQTFLFSLAQRTISEPEFLQIAGNTEEAKSASPILWIIFKDNFLHSDNALNRSVADIVHPNFLAVIRDTLTRVFSEKVTEEFCRQAAQRVINACLENLKSVCITRAKNNELFNFFICIARTCDELKQDAALGKVINPVDEVNLGIITPIQFATLKRLPLPISEVDMLPLPHLCEQQLINEINITEWFSTTPYFLKDEESPLPFPLTVDQLAPDLPAVNVFSKGFGRHFIKDMESSYKAYLETPMALYQLLQPIESLESHLLERIIQYREVTQVIWHNLRQILLTVPHTSTGQIFSLLRHSGQQSFYTKHDTLSALMNSKCLTDENPFLENYHSLVFDELRRYILCEIQRMHFERVIDLIVQYKELEDADEKNLILHEIAKQLVHKRSYKEELYPSWLLFELENNLVIREVQAVLTQIMVDGVEKYTQSKAGELFQLNMGEGKTSVILILLAQYLSDGNRLVRINVLEPLIGMMKDLLATKFGGLLKKRVYHMPFSRDIDTSLENLQKILSTMEECKKNRHILLTMPEHRLCLQLKWQEKLLQYVEFKGADNKFNGNKYTNYYKSRSYSFSLTSTLDDYFFSEIEMKDILKKAGYIDDSGTISTSKPPEKDERVFVNFLCSVMSKNSIRYKWGARGAHFVLTTQSIAFRKEIESQLALLTTIAQTTFCDILDESDEVLRHGSELNYTLGDSQPLDGGSCRWRVPCYLFNILFFDSEVQDYLQCGAIEGRAILISPWKSSSGLGGGVPYVRFIDKVFFESMREVLAKKLLNKISRKLRIDESNLFTKPIYEEFTYLDFILGKAATEESEAEKEIIDGLEENSYLELLPMLLLAKAWLTHNILYHVMSQRYRVEYGFDAKPGDIPKNDMAIPYKGMNMPAIRSEFSHPDVMIGLTILSYYYNGLHESQLVQVLREVSKSPTDEKNTQLLKWFHQNKGWIIEDTNGSMTNRVGQDRKFGYTKLTVAGDGNCGYTALGMTREQALELLTSNSRNVVGLLQLPTQQALLTEEFYAYLKENHIIRDDVTHESITGNPEILNGYAAWDKVQETYIHYDVRDTRIAAGYAHPRVLQALSHILAIELRIWRLGDANVLTPHIFHEENYALYRPENAASRVDLLYVNGNHFERLDLSSYGDQIPEEGLYPLDSSWSHTNADPVNFPTWLKSFITLDLDSDQHRKLATRYLSRNTSLINYFLNTIVFPKKAKYYERKITGNAHTLAGEGNTTGFSGTDDRKETMPATVVSCCLPPQASINGKMLHIVTRVVNSTYRSLPRLSCVEDFLEAVALYTHNMAHGCHALIDAGAMTAGMSNYQVAKFLLTRIAKKFKGVIFFDDESGRTLVLTHHKKVTQTMSLSTCHLDKQELFVFFDDAHTRGSDLKLSWKSHGIVTLSRQMNKDKIMQAAMRFRQLDNKQSICFWGSEEISHEIARITGSQITAITSKEVLLWITYNTIQKISSELYSVTIKKFEYIIKRRALQYQERNISVPIGALIDRCAERVPDKLSILYGATPISQEGVSGLLENRSVEIQDDFKSKLDDELLERGISLIGRDLHANDFSLDKQEMDVILSTITTKLPEEVMLAVSLESDQEKEKEVEREQALEVVPPEKRTPCAEEAWKFEKVFDHDFVQKSMRGHFAYRSIKTLLDSASDPTNVAPQLIIVRKRSPNLIAYWQTENGMLKKHFPESQVTDIIRDLPAQGTESTNPYLVRKISEKYGCSDYLKDPDYPKLLPLTDCLCSVSRIKEYAEHIAWHPQIVATNNFFQTVTVIEGQKSQDDYLRPVDTIIIHKKSGTTFFIITSGFEASEIYKLFGTGLEELNIFLLHLSDVNGDMMLPSGRIQAVFLSEEEQYMKIVLQLFNGECRFNPDKEHLLEQALGIVTCSAFQNQEISQEGSEFTYQHLRGRDYLQQGGFFTSRLIEDMSCGNLELPTSTSLLNKREFITQKLVSIQQKSIINHEEVRSLFVLSKTPTFFKSMINLRDKLNEFHGSVLKEKIGPI